MALTRVTLVLSGLVCTGCGDGKEADGSEPETHQHDDGTVHDVNDQGDHSHDTSKHHH